MGQGHSVYRKTDSLKEPSVTKHANHNQTTFCHHPRPRRSRRISRRCNRRANARPGYIARRIQCSKRANSRGAARAVDGARSALASLQAQWACQRITPKSSSTSPRAAARAQKGQLPGVQQAAARPLDVAPPHPRARHCPKCGRTISRVNPFNPIKRHCLICRVKLKMKEYAREEQDKAQPD